MKATFNIPTTKYKIGQKFLRENINNNKCQYYKIIDIKLKGKWDYENNRINIYIDEVKYVASIIDSSYSDSTFPILINPNTIVIFHEKDLDKFKLWYPPAIVNHTNSIRSTIVTFNETIWKNKFSNKRITSL